MNDDELKLVARDFIKRNSKTIVERYANREAVPPVVRPETILMAGPPGAGKTEFTQELIEEYETREETPRYVLLDPDAIREDLEGYTGENAELFNSAVSLAVDKILDHVYKHSQNVIIDGTLSHLEVAEKNVDRALRHKRDIAVIYVYQDPVLAWNFVKKREALEKRRVSKTAFIDAFMKSRINANSIKKKYRKYLDLHIVEKDSYNKFKRFHYNVGSIDSYVKDMHNRESLEEVLNGL